MHDLQLERYGSNVLLRPVSPEGEAWTERHVTPPRRQCIGAALLLAPNQALATAADATAAGLAVEIH